MLTCVLHPTVCGHLIDVVRRAGGLVNGTRCKLKSLTWLPEVQDDVIEKIRRGTLRPRADGEAYVVPRPFTVNVEVTNKDGSTTPVSIHEYTYYLPREAYLRGAKVGDPGRCGIR